MTDKCGAREAAQLVVDIDNRMLKLLDHLRRVHMIGATDEECSGGSCDTVRRYESYEPVNNLLRGFNYEAIYEHRPLNARNVAYSVDKGRRIVLCLRDPFNDGRVIDPDILMFVVLHESAHVANNEWGHGPRFWSIFKYLLQCASELNVYEPRDYSKHPVKYCGFVISHNPLYDDRFRAISGPRGV